MTFEQCLMLDYGKLKQINTILYGLASLSYVKDNIKLFESTEIEPFEFKLLG